MRRFALLLTLIGCSSPSESTPAPVNDTGSADTGADEVAVDAEVKCTPGRTEADRPDDAEGYQVRLWYVIPSDGKDEEHDTNGRIERAFLAVNEWLGKQTGGTKLRVDTCDGKLDIGFKRLLKTDAQIKATGAYVLDQIQREMGKRDKKIYAVYYGGGSTYSCGGGMWPPVKPGHVCAMYLHGTPTTSPYPCDSHELARPDIPLGYFELGIMHEIFHTLGGAATCSPHHFEEGHVSDGSKDLLYRGSDPWDIGPQMTLDIGKDDYWGHMNAGCLDLSKSAFLDPLPADAQLPPKW
jgi:hypothetical protein